MSKAELASKLYKMASDEYEAVQLYLPLLDELPPEYAKHVLGIIKDELRHAGIFVGIADKVLGAIGGRGFLTGYDDVTGRNLLKYFVEGD